VFEEQFDRSHNDVDNSFSAVLEERQYEVARRVLDALPAQVAFIGSDGMVRLVNREWELFAVQNGGSHNVSGVGSNYFAACEGSEEGEQIKQGILDVLSGEVPSFSLEYPCHTPVQQRWFTVRCTASADRSEVVVVHFDTTTQKRAEVTLAELATRDHLTGVLNRRGFDQQLRIEQHRLDRSGLSAVALLIDCDDFKKVNELVGLAGGDVVLAGLAERIQSSLRPGDTLARIGGDEFIVLVPEARSAEADLVAERIRLAVSSSAIAVSHNEIHVTVSIAITVFDSQTRTLEGLLERSRFALETSKRDGKNRSTHAGAIRRTSVNRSQQGLAELMEDPHGLSVVAQPIINLTSHATVGYEMLTRINGPLSGLGPLTLFQLAQENGVLLTLDERCLRSCAAVAKTLPRGVYRHLNVYPSTLLHLEKGAFEEIFGGAEMGEFCIELSEQQILGDASYLAEPIRMLRNLGVRIAIDDVGFGRTALESLIILEPEVVKIDQSHVHGVAGDVQRQRWLQRLVRAAKSLHAELIAEGIEDAADAQVVRDLGVNFGQGYLYGRPAALVDVTDTALLVLP
jgi:diguanylate cyclase (GGDEF)-like protein